MANNLVYGDQSIAQAPDNSAGIITADALRSVIVSQRSGGAQVLDTSTFTIPVVADTPVAINPLLPAATSGGVLWAVDGNNRLYPNYAAAIPDLVIPTGYSKLVQVFITFAADKVGQGEDPYIFQLDNNGVPFGQGVSYTLTPDPTVVSLLVNASVELDSGVLLGLTVTGDGTGDDIAVSAFEMFVIDFQRWSAPA